MFFILFFYLTGQAAITPIIIDSKPSQQIEDGLFIGGKSGFSFSLLNLRKQSFTKQKKRKMAFHSW